MAEIYDPTMEPLRDESNFYRWKFEMTHHLHVLQFDDIVLGKEPRPDTPPSSSSSTKTDEQTRWDKDSSNAVYFMRIHVSPELEGLFSFSSTAPEVWKLLNRYFHNRRPRMLLRRLAHITHLRLREGECIAEHLKAFEDAWFDLKMRTADAPPIVEGVQNSLETVLHIMTQSELSKAEMLIDSLPEDMWMIGFRLGESHGVELHSLHVSVALMDLHEQQVSRNQEKEEEEEEAVEDCTWCRSRGYESAGHGWKKCVRLRQFKKEKADGRARRA